MKKDNKSILVVLSVSYFFLLRISFPNEFIFTSKFSFVDIGNSVHPGMNTKCLGFAQNKFEIYEFNGEMKNI